MHRLLQEKTAVGELRAKPAAQDLRTVVMPDAGGAFDSSGGGRRFMNAGSWATSRSTCRIFADGLFDDCSLWGDRLIAYK